MEVILKEKINKLGNIGDVVNVKNGFAKNYLLSKGKAMYATPEHKKLFDQQKVRLEEENANKLKTAEEDAKKITNKSFIFTRNAGENGHLYGSVTTKHISESLKKANVNLALEQIKIPHPIKSVGIYEVSLLLHADVIAPIYVIVARNEDEAEVMFKEHTENQKKAKEKEEKSLEAGASANKKLEKDAPVKKQNKKAKEPAETTDISA